MEYKGLPVLLLDIVDDPTHETGISENAIVDDPAIKLSFIAFNDQPRLQQFAVASEDRRIITGPLLVPDQPVYRNDKKGEYYAMFTRDAVERTALKFFRQGNGNKVNLMHNTGELVSDIVLFESFIYDTSRGVQPVKGFEGVPEGTWFVSYKVDNEKVWQDIKDGTFKGFSMQGLFNHITTEDDEAELAELRATAELLRDKLRQVVEKI
ncbi:MAG: hypothetical protein EOP49_17620 [Sphingobacteriales bacterium]|nr:MAG: hypothetical protein EOP49_17620 [Sphingobacteriales bacterium]